MYLEIVALSLPGGALPLFGKWFDDAHHPELVEGEGARERVL